MLEFSHCDAVRSEMAFNFVAVDFETANRAHASVCAVGAVKVRDGAIVDEFRTLVRPPPGFDEFDDANVRAHQITASDVMTAPEWPDVYRRLRAFIGDDTVVGHNIRFDTAVLLNACGAYDIHWPQLDTVCTLQLSRATLKLPSYSLPWVADHLGVPAFDHHEPLADARASAEVLVAIAALTAAESFDELMTSARVPAVPTWLDRDDDLFAALSGDPDDVVGTGFAGEVVCFTGALKMMVRNRARELVVEQGGTWQDGVTLTTTILVTGDLDERTFRPGAVFSSKLAKAFDRVEKGQRLEIITEEAFIARMDIGFEELRAKLAAGATRSKVPEWVITQAGSGPNGDFWAWYRAALQHPNGRAAGGEPCVWCVAEVPANAHWIHRERHVCGVHCNERLKRGARRAWDRAGISFGMPESPGWMA